VPAVLTPSHHKGSQTSRIELARVVPKALEQFVNLDAIVMESGLAGSALSPHPLVECSKWSRLLKSGLNDTCADYGGIAKMSNEQAYSSNLSLPLSAAVSRASTSTKVKSERLNKMLVKLCDRYVSAAREAREMLCRSNQYPHPVV